MEEHQFQAVAKMIEKSLKENWDRPSLSDFNVRTMNFSEVAERIAAIHIVFGHCGYERGTTMAICAKNCANWALSFLAIYTYGAVPVPLLHEFKPANIHYLLSHSDSKVLFVDDQIWETLDEAELPGVDTVVSVNDFRILVSRSGKAAYARENIDVMFKEKYPNGFGKEDVCYQDENPDDLAIINYTSGTSGFSKGVMLSKRSFWSNMDFGFSIKTGFCNTVNHLAILPAAHMYGLMFELMYEFLCGVHVHYLSKIPSPRVLTQALGEVRPKLVISVPLVIEKVYRNMLRPVLEKPLVKTMLRWVPFFECVLLNRMKKELSASFGGNFYEVIVGGAAFNKEVETFFRKMKFKFTVGYGMTECGPIITYAPWDETKLGSSGKAAPNMELRIDSKDPENIPGEIQCRGANVFMGYFKNEEATAQSFTADGWFRTGDMGVMDKDGYLFIKGRCKCMILGPSGQNIYPEELETMVNNLPYVVESLIVDDHGTITALVYPDFRKAEQDGLDRGQLTASIEANVAVINADMPNYSLIKKVEIMEEDFERTPKKSIKRYLYQR